MVDYEAIGRRIKEQRKSIRKISQETMAIDLNMYQADISNLEKANTGSGISDLNKLDLIAEYFDIPLETLIFGGNNKMEKYYGKKMVLKNVKRRISKKHTDLLLHVTGLENLDEKPIIYDCGPYSIYIFQEYQMTLGDNLQPDFVVVKPHVYVIYGDEIIGTLTAYLTTVMQHVFQPALASLQQIIPFEVLDVTDVIRTLNPYWALWRFDDNGDQYIDALAKRMDQLREYGEDKPIIYIENIYIREDSRKNGICRMIIELLKSHFCDPILWLNMEPTSGMELNSDSNYFADYTISEVGQININNAIAEHLGFTVDSDVWHKQAETINSDGEIEIKAIEVRKCAYYLPKQVREVIKYDNDLVAQGRALQKLKTDQSNKDEPVDIDHKIIDDYLISQVRCYVGDPNGNRIRLCFSAAKSLKNGDLKFGVSRGMFVKLGMDHDGQLESYDSLEKAQNSFYYDQINMAYHLIAIAEPCDDHPTEDDELGLEIKDINFACNTDVEVYIIEATCTDVDEDGNKYGLYAVIYYDAETNEKSYILATESFMDYQQNNKDMELWNKSIIAGWDNQLPSIDEIPFIQIFIDLDEMLYQHFNFK